MGDITPDPATQPWRRAPLAFWLAVGGLVLWVLGVLLPWAEFDLRFNSPLGASFEREIAELVEARFEPASGYDLGSNTGLQPDEGRIALVLALGFAVAFGVHVSGALPGRLLPIAMTAIAAVTLIVVAVELTDLDDATSAVGVAVDVGAGIWVTLVGTIAAAVGGIVAAVQSEPTPADQPPPA